VIRDSNVTGLLPIFKYNGTRMSDPKKYEDIETIIKSIQQNLPNPNAKLGYEINPEACACEIPNSSL